MPHSFLHSDLNLRSTCKSTLAGRSRVLLRLGRPQAARVTSSTVPGTAGTAEFSAGTQSPAAPGRSFLQGGAEFPPDSDFKSGRRSFPRHVIAQPARLGYAPQAQALGHFFEWLPARRKESARAHPTCFGPTTPKHRAGDRALRSIRPKRNSPDFRTRQGEQSLVARRGR